MKIAIMQPTFLPWIGYFSMMSEVDKFVLLDDVQFERRSWQQRNKILTSNGPIWLTVPVANKSLRLQQINDVQILYEKDFIKKIIRSIELNYSKAPHYKLYSKKIYSILEERPKKLSILTIRLIKEIKKILEIKTKLILSSEMNINGKREERLLNICLSLKAKTYLSPPNSKSYLDQSDIFNKNNIVLEYFNYSHPTYPQLIKEFQPYISVIDLIFNCGRSSKDYL